MVRRGQVTVFIIIGIIIIGIIFLAIFMMKPKNKVPQDSSGDYEKLHYVAQLCAEISAKQALWRSANSGFYDASSYAQNEIIVYKESFYNPQDSSVIYTEEMVRPIYLINDNMNIPSKSEQQKSISKIYNILFDNCIDDSNISVQFPQFRRGDAESEIQINDKNILFETKPNIVTTNKGTEINLKDVTYTLDYSIKEKTEIVKSFLVSQSQDDALPISKLSILAKKNNFFYSINYLENNNIVFEFIFNDYYPENGGKIIYAFAVNYDWPEVST
jgi:hypothetical protein